MRRQISIGASWEKTVRGVSFAVIGMAVVVLFGWWFHIRTAVQVFRGLIPMQFNTALCFLALGAAGIGLYGGRRALMFCGGSFAALMGAAVILEYATGFSLGIDTLFFYPWDRTLSADPGRMALTTAISFLLSGGALAILALRQGAYAVFGIVNSVPLSLALTSLIGYAFQITYLLPFGLGSQMSLHTSSALLTFGIAMLGYAWKYGERGLDGLPKWGAGIGVTLLPVLLVGAGALFPTQSWRVVLFEVLISLIAIGLISLAVIRLKTAKVAFKGLLMIATPLILILVFVGLVVHVKHESQSAQDLALRSKEVIDVSQSLLTNIAETESAVRGYIITGDEAFVASYATSLDLITRTTAQLRVLVTVEGQQVRAREIEELAAERMERFAEIFRLIRSGNKTLAEEEIKGGTGPRLMKQIRAELNEFSKDQERIDAERRLMLDASWQRLSWLLVAGTAGAILLASILTLSFSGGISRRLHHLRDNAISLAAGKELAPPLTGNDEIAELDKVFHEMAESLDELSRREKAVIEGTSDAIFVKDRDHRFLMINRAGAASLGSTVEAIMGASNEELVDADTARKLRETDNAVLASGQTTSYEFTTTIKSGVERTFSTTRAPYRDRHGKIVGIMGINRDITESKRAEAERQAISEIVQAVITTDSLDELFNLVHVSIGKLLFAENCYIALHDKSTDLIRVPFCRDEFDTVAAPHKLGKGLTAFVLRSGRPMLMNPELIQELVLSGEIELVGTLPAAWIGVPLRTSNEIIGVLVVQHYENTHAYDQQDVSLLASVADQLGLAIKHKQIEIKLKTNEMQLNAAQQIAHVGSWEWDVIEKKLNGSAELFRIFGLQPQENGLTAKEVFARIHPEDLGLVNAAVKRAFRGAKVLEFDVRIVRSDKTVRVLQMNGEVVTDDTDRVIRLWGTTQDITERKRAEKEREVISEIIQSVNLTKNLDELLKQVQHSIKTVLYAENCSVVLYEKHTGLLEAPPSVDPVDENPFPTPTGNVSISGLFSSRLPLLMSEATFDEIQSRPGDAAGRPSPSFLSVPLITPTETIGVLTVQHYEKDNVYSPHDMEFLAAVAAQLTLAIERKRAEEALIESNRRFRDLFYDAPVGYHELDTEGRITCVNTTELLMLGYSSEEMIGHHVWEFIKEGDIARATFAEKLAGLKPLKSVERSFRCKDGAFMPVQLDDQMLYDPNGRTIGIRATMQNIVERKRAEEALMQSEHRFRDLFENASDVIYTSDFDGNFTSLNTSGERMTGYSREEALNLNISQVVSPETLSIVQEMTKRKIESADETVYEVEFFKKGGEHLLVEVSSRAIFENGRAIGIQGIGRDITQRKQVEADLKFARDAALESARLKSDFLANMSHEIRTPMNGVIGMTGLLLDTNLTVEQREYTETISNSADALLIIIDDILDFSKIEAGLMRFENIDFDLRAAVEGTVDLLAEKARAKGLELASLVYRDVPTQLLGDPGRLRQVLTNLAGNALKFTDRGEVVVSAKRVNETASRATLRFEIRDTGIGISEEAQSLLFNAFTQADGSTTRKYGGTGLGLAISKQLVEHMGGQIGIESTPGRGSTFWFTAEFEKQSEPAMTAFETPGRLAAARVLIVDDNATNRSILNHQTSSWGMIAVEAESGEQALELLRTGAALGQPYDIAILDLMMPEMDGFMLAESIKADPLIAPVALVLLPSFGQPGDGEKARRLGIAAYLQKPVRQSRLYDCLIGVFAPHNDANSNMPARPVPKPSIPEAEVQKQERTFSTLRIIIAEDNIVNQRVALGQLRNLGYRAEAVFNGRKLIEAMENAEFDLILMDCQMPEMDGFAATAEIRRREGNSRHTVIIAMTANALDGDDKKCLAAGMDDYLSKPVKPDVLRQKLERWGKLGDTPREEELIEEAVPVM